MPNVSSAPIFNIRGFVAALLIASILCWPAYLAGGAFIYYDTEGYLNAGAAIWSILGDAIGLNLEIAVASPEDASMRQS